MLLPKRSKSEILRDVELNRFNVPQGLRGLVLDSLKELKAKFPRDKNFGEVFLRTHQKNIYSPMGFDRYSRPLKKVESITFNVAYGYPKCKKIIIGPPKIKTENSITFLAGREGLDYFCSNCDAHIYMITLTLS